MAATLTSLRLGAFKNMRQTEIPLGPLTLLVGRNGSGKSNVLDALAVLSALASGTNLQDALDGGRAGPLVRGGSEGCAPLGSDSFAVGCSVAIDRVHYHLDLKVVVRPALQIVSERLWTRRRSGSHYGDPQDLLKTVPSEPNSGEIKALWYDSKEGSNPEINFRPSQLLTAQVATGIPATSETGRHFAKIAKETINALSNVVVLEPVPHLMREWASAKNVLLGRNAENLSSVLANLLRGDATRSVLLEMIRSLSEGQVSELNAVTSDLGEVMITIRERIGPTEQQTPARLMSDGSLRLLAIAAALLDLSHRDGESQKGDGGRMLVVDEIESALHPSQAAVLLNQLKESSSSGVRTLATTHSPAILDALDGKDHSSVVVCSRRPDGWNTATRLTEFPDYFEVVGRSPLGTAAVRDQLRPGDESAPSEHSLVDVL